MAILKTGVVGSSLSEGAVWVGDSSDKAVEIPPGPNRQVLTSDGTTLSFQPGTITVEADSKINEGIDTIRFLNTTDWQVLPGLGGNIIEIDYDYAPVDHTYIVGDESYDLPRQRLLGVVDFELSLVVDQPNKRITLGLFDNTIMPGNEGMTVPLGTTSEQPAASNGLLRFNTDTTEMEFSNGTDWFNVASKSYVDGPSRYSALSADPTDPPPGETVVWMSDGTDTGDAGDLMVRVNVGGTIKTTTLVDYSTIL